MTLAQIRPLMGPVRKARENLHQAQSTYEGLLEQLAHTLRGLTAPQLRALADELEAEAKRHE